MKFIVILLAFVCVSLPAFAGDVSARSTLVRGTIISADDIVLGAGSDEDTNKLLATFVGKQVKRTIYSGQVINAGFVGAPVLVRRNSRVTMIYKNGVLEISAFGRALGEGGAGDIVTVMNLDSRKRVSGVVRDSGIVEVKL